jgi:hypothetical protein
MSSCTEDAELAQNSAEHWFLENQPRIEALGLRASFQRTTPEGMGPHARITFENENVAAEALVFYEGSVALLGGQIEPAVDFMSPNERLGSTREKLDAVLDTIACFSS